MGAASRKRRAAGARNDEDAEPIRDHTDARETGAPRTPLHVSVPAVKRVKRESGGGAEGAAAMRTPPVGTPATHPTALACGAPRGYDAYADRANAKHAQASRGTGAAAGWTACPLCVRKLQARGKSGNVQKRFAVGRGLRAHLDAKHRAEYADDAAWAAAAAAAVAQAQACWPSFTGDAAAVAADSRGGVDLRPVAPGQTRTGAAATPYADSLHEGLRAARDGDTTCLRRLAADGWQWWLEVDRHGATAAQWAAGGGHVECLRFLLEECGAVPTAASGGRKRDGKTALHWAARNGHVQAVRYLLSVTGATVDAPTGDGTTPLHLACYGGHTALVQTLVQAGADPSRANDWHCDATHWAAMGCDAAAAPAVCQVLWARGCAFDRPQAEGHTPAHKAAQRGHREPLLWLKHTARLPPPPLDASGRSVADVAACCGFEGLAEELRSWGW